MRAGVHNISHAGEVGFFVQKLLEVPTCVSSITLFLLASQSAGISEVVNVSNNNNSESEAMSRIAKGGVSSLIKSGVSPTPDAFAVEHKMLNIQGIFYKTNKVRVSRFLQVLKFLTWYLYEYILCL